MKPPFQSPFRFVFGHLNATSGRVAGSFNDWQLETESRRPAGANHSHPETSASREASEGGLVVDGRCATRLAGGTQI